MKSVFHELGADDKKAQDLLLDSLAICAHNHILSRKLLDRFSTAAGTPTETMTQLIRSEKLLARFSMVPGLMYAIIGDWFDLKQMVNYNYTILPPQGSGHYSPGDFPQDRLVNFVREYLQKSPKGIVICENWGTNREYIDKRIQAWAPPKTAWFGDNEVYHIVTPADTDSDQIQAAVMERHQWQTNVCSSCAQVPEGDIPSEAFLDEIVENTRHIFIPAFDGSGYLIWTPKT